MRKLTIRLLLIGALGCLSVCGSNEPETQKPAEKKSLQQNFREMEIANRIRASEQMRKSFQFSDAARHLETALLRASSPKLMQPYLQLLYQSHVTDDLQKGLEKLQKKYPSIKKQPLFHFYRAEVAARKHGAAKARPYLKKCLVMNVNTAPCERMLLEVHMELQRNQELLEQSSDYLRRYPEDTGIRNRLTQYWLEQGDLPKATKYLQALEASGTPAQQLLWSKAQLAQARGSWTESGVLLEKLLQRTPEDWRVLFALAEVKKQNSYLKTIFQQAPPVAQCFDIYRSRFPKNEKEKSTPEIRRKLLQQCSSESLVILARARLLAKQTQQAREAADMADQNARFKGMYKNLWQKLKLLPAGRSTND